MKILFIAPLNSSNIPETYFIHLGIGYLASSLKLTHLDTEFRMIHTDPSVAIKTWHPDIVCITSVSQYWNRAKEYAKTAKFAKLPVIVGGVHVSTLPQTMTSDMDIAVIGEGEQTFAELISGYISSKEFPLVPGIAYHSNGEIKLTESRKEVQDLDTLPFPDRSFQEIKERTSMFSSRGCPYFCSFCASTRYFHKTRFFSADYVAEEIHLLYLRYHVNHISLLDDLFIADKKRLVELYELLGRRNLLGKLKYICNVRSNLVTDDLCRILASMGVETVGMGIESACPTTLAYLKGHGNITVSDHANALELLHKYHITAHPSFIIGSPYETYSDIMMSYDFIKSHKVPDFEVYVLMPFPGTPVWDYAKSRNLVSDDMDWDKLQYTALDFNRNSIIVSEYLSYPEMQRTYDQFTALRKSAKQKSMILEGLRHPHKAAKYILKELSI